MAHFKFNIDLWVEGETEEEAEKRMESLFDFEPFGEVELIGWECRYSDDEPGVCCCTHESTTFNPHYIDEYGTHFICGVECGSCHEKISRTYHYCPYCGKAVKWE